MRSRVTRHHICNPLMALMSHNEEYSLQSPWHMTKLSLNIDSADPFLTLHKPSFHWCMRSNMCIGSSWLTLMLLKTYFSGSFVLRREAECGLNEDDPSLSRIGSVGEVTRRTNMSFPTRLNSPMIDCWDLTPSLEHILPSGSLSTVLPDSTLFQGCRSATDRRDGHVNSWETGSSADQSSTEPLTALSITRADEPWMLGKMHVCHFWRPAL
ncbi:unnamed protein product [Protopolystoma xenopodis]|uniref:Uncharacterized protein n=1 Tax=Protopolystoma xenopodis TaxID=117903 RepID=A0A448WA25_9PLAT|nr:unnamed protein product [Protopolystoma xenopodis]